MKNFLRFRRFFISENADAVWFRPLVPLAAAFISGIISGEAFSGHTISAWTGAGISLFFIFRAIYRRCPAFFSPLFVIFCLGYISIQPWANSVMPDNHILRLADSRKHAISGTVCAVPEISDRRTVFLLEAARTDDVHVSGLIRATVYDPPFPALSPGDRVRFSGTLRPVRNFSNPGGFDYKRHMAFQGIFALASVRRGTLEIIETASGNGPDARIHAVRQQIRELIRSAASGDTADVLCALITGDRLIRPELREQFSRAGIAHLLAISGLHIGLVAGISFFIFRRFLACFSIFLWNGWTRKAAALLSLGPVFAYGLISGMSPATQRAIIMAAAVMLTFHISRKPDRFSLLAIAALVILMIHPPTLFSISFQLSFSAVAGIMAGMGNPPEPAASRVPVLQRMMLRAGTLVNLSVFAILGTLPLTLYYFNQVSFTGIISNIFFIPLIGIFVVAPGLVAAGICFLSYDMAFYIMKATGFVLSQTLALVPFFSGISWGTVQAVTPTIPEIIGYYILAGAVCMVRRIDEPERSRRIKMIIMVTLCLISADSIYWVHRRFLHRELRITVLDVGQGSSALVEFPGGTCMLVDGGGFYDNSVFDTGKQIVAPFLLGQRIRTVDTLVLSHPDTDHLGGLLYIAENFHPAKLLTGGPLRDDPACNRLREIVREKNIEMPDIEKTDRQWNAGAVLVEMLYPIPGFAEKPEKWRKKSNNSSLVLRLSLGKYSFLLPGDIEAPAEAELARTAGDRIRSTVLVAPHHGSKTSSTAAFLDKTDPETMIVSCGFRNRFGCPHPSVIRRYEARDCRILRTDGDGAIRMICDGNHMRIISCIRK